ncbi:MAG: acyltransferase family protein [Candidatus Dormiibacterota bacterium]
MAGLDGLRAVAVLAVIAYHLNLGWASGGQLGVGVFFVISGYLITDLLLAQRQSRGSIDLGRFWLRRARRLLPALWVMLVAVTLWVSFADSGQVPALRGDLLGALFYYSNWWYAFQHVSYFALFAPLTPLGHLWSLAVEEQFYLVWPLLLIVALRFIRRRDVMISLLLVAAAASAIAMAAMYQQGSDPTRVYEGTDTRAFQLLIGGALAFALPSGRLTEAMSRLTRCGFEALGVLGLAGIVVLVVLTNQYDPFLYRGGMVLLSIASLAVVASLAHPGTLVGRALGVRPLRWIGVRSYGIYLWSYPIIVLTTPPDATGSGELVRMALQVAATLVIAALSWRFIEQPIRTRGFTSVISRLRAPRIRIIGVPAGLVAGSCAAGVVLAASGVGLTGVVPSAVTASALSALPSSLVMTPSDRTPAATPAPLPCGSPSPAASPSPTPSTTPAPSLPPPSPDSVPTTVIGDSIMIDLAPHLHPLLPGAFIDGQVSRQMSELPALLSQLRSQGLLYSRVVVELGTNGPGWDPGQIAGALRSYGFSTVVLVNAGEDPDHPDWAPLINQELAQVAALVPAATIVNWYSASLGHPAYFMWGSVMGDGIHPGPQGAQVLATMIAQAVDSGHSAAATVAVHPLSPAPARLLGCAS